MLTDAPVPYRPVSRWTDRFPWITAGMTHRGTGDSPFDLRLFGNAAPPAAGRRWQALLTATGFPGAAHARQVHGTRIAVCLALHEGLHAGGKPADGHATSAAGVLLAVTVADCVPVYLVDPEHRAVALLHAGWRGTASDRPPSAPRPGDLRGLLRGGAGGLQGPGPFRAIRPGTGGCARRPHRPGARARSAPRPRQRLRRLHALRRRRLLLPQAGRPRTPGGVSRHPPVRQPAGLCADCVFRRTTRNRRGSVFVLCRRSASDPRYPKYPPLPVLRCRGFEPDGDPHLRDEEE